jgi:hypothetical protein
MYLSFAVEIAVGDVGMRLCSLMVEKLHSGTPGNCTCMQYKDTVTAYPASLADIAAA